MEKLSFEQMENLSGGGSLNSVACNAAWNLAGVPWTVGIGMASAGIGAVVFGFAWGVAGSIICP